ncbi:hypothetical protein Tco_0952735 [Tanacetum coccineum]|uniref:Uncharacterized protein n=1 Tax=Tanacetum coccineum TaxID=301880 RepID=A0ABQ5DY66_9ASTR
MSDTVPPIPPPFGANTGNPSSPIRAGNPADTINNTTTTNVVQNVVNENLPQLLDSRGGSHVTNVPIPGDEIGSVSTSDTYGSEEDDTHSQHVELSKQDLKKKVGISVRKEVHKGMLSRAQTRLEEEIFAKANAEGEKWEKNNLESPKSATYTKEEHKLDVNSKVQGEHLSKNKSENAMIIHTLEEKTSEDEPPSKKPKFEIPREILSLTPLKSIMPQITTPIVINMPKNQDSSTLSKPTNKGKAIATEEDPTKALIPFLAEIGSSPKISDFKSFSSDGGLMILENAKAQLEEFRRIELLKVEKEKSERELAKLLNLATVKA